MAKPGPKRSINVNDNVIVAKVGSTFYGKEGTVRDYIPSTSTSFASYVRVEFADGSTRTFRPAEVKLLREEPPYGMENEPMQRRNRPTTIGEYFK